MDYHEVQRIHWKHFFTSYPVVNKKKKVIGVFNYEVFNWVQIKEKKAQWQDYITKPVFLLPTVKLDYVLKKLQKKKCQMAIVQKKGLTVGIITLKNILESLVGKIPHDRDLNLLNNKKLHG